MLLLKLTLTPLFIGLISLAGRRWGTRVSGWLVGLPLTSAPIALFLALEQGTTFASRAVFFLVVADLLMQWGILVTFSGAALAALLTQGCMLWLLQRSGSAAPGQKTNKQATGE